jgi:hypothetical protein
VKLRSPRFAAALVLFTLGCEPELARIELHARTTPPGSIELSEQAIRIPNGLAVGFLATALDESDSPMPPETTVEMASPDPEIVGVDPSLELGAFVVYGVSPGSTEVSVAVNGEFYSSIPVRVTEHTDP